MRTQCEWAHGLGMTRGTAGFARWRSMGVSAGLVSVMLMLVCVGWSAPPVSAAVIAKPSTITDSSDPSSGRYFTAVRESGSAAVSAGQPAMPMATAPATQFVPIPPERDVDTRLEPGEPMLDGDRIIMGPGPDLPPGITAVAFNIIATGQTASGYLEVAPRDAPAGSSTLNWTGSQQTIANGHVTRVTAAEEFQIVLHSVGSAHVILDVTGYFAPAGAEDATLYTPANRRLFDSRAEDGPLLPGQVQYINVNDGGAPAVAPTAAAINVTATGTTGSGVFSAAAFQTSVTSTINWSGGAQTVANAVITSIGDDGWLAVTNNGQTSAHLVVDLTGVFAPTAAGATGAQYYAMDPYRSYDSRVVGGILVGGSTRANTHPVPTGAVAIAVNTTITGTTGTGYISVTPPGAPLPPTTSTVNWFSSPTTRANGAMVPVVGANTRAYAGGSYATHYIYDVAGYFQ